MALVANYDSSDEEHSSEEETEPTVPTVLNAAADVASVNKLPEPSTTTAVPSSSSSIKGHFNFFEDDDDEELDQEEVEGGGALANLLPKPREGPQGGIDIEEVGPIPPKKVYGDEEEKPPPPSSISTTFHNITSTRTQGSKIKITAPSLKDVRVFTVY